MDNTLVSISVICALWRNKCFLCYSQTFEAKMHHLETRPSRKPKDGPQDLEYFVRCEVHLSDVNTLISSLRRIADDVRTTKEVKCKLFEFLYYYRLHFNIILLGLQLKCFTIKCYIFVWLFHPLKFTGSQRKLLNWINAITWWLNLIPIWIRIIQWVNVPLL